MSDSATGIDDECGSLDSHKLSAITIPFSPGTVFFSDHVIWIGQ